MPSESSGWSGASANAKGDDRLVVPFFLGNPLVTFYSYQFSFACCNCLKDGREERIRTSDPSVPKGGFSPFIYLKFRCCFE